MNLSTLPNTSFIPDSWTAPTGSSDENIIFLPEEILS